MISWGVLGRAVPAGQRGDSTKPWWGPWSCVRSSGLLSTRNIRNYWRGSSGKWLGNGNISWEEWLRELRLFSLDLINVCQFLKGGCQEEEMRQEITGTNWNTGSALWIEGFFFFVGGVFVMFFGLDFVVVFVDLFVGDKALRQAAQRCCRWSWEGPSNPHHSVIVNYC